MVETKQEFSSLLPRDVTMGCCSSAQLAFRARSFNFGSGGMALPERFQAPTAMAVWPSQRSTAEGLSLLQLPRRFFKADSSCVNSTGQITY